MGKLYFVTGNTNKFKEMEAIAKLDGICLTEFSLSIRELQTKDVEDLVKKKAFEAFKEIRRPLIIEHTMLKIDAFNQLPGPQTSYIYSQLGDQIIVGFCRYRNQFGASAESLLCYCDGKDYIIARGEEKGRISQKADFAREAFDWDRIFKPDENNEEDATYADRSGKKAQYSMRRKAWDNLRQEMEEKGILEQYKIPAPGEPLSVTDDRRKETESQSDLEALADLISQKKVMLFIGAGISRSLQMPLWSELLKSLVADEFDGDLFETYGDNMVLAEYIRKQYGNEAVYQKMRNLFTIHEDTQRELENSKIYQAILELGCPVIYTTNYDHLLESYYKMKRGEESYDRVVTIEDMGKVRAGATRIMKFHGDISDRDSIVLAESEYFGRMDFQNFMDVQLQADMLRYHVLFLGYSLSDINVKMLLYLAGKRRKGQGKCSKTSDMKNYIFTATPNQVQKAVFEDNQIITLWGENADKKAGTEEFLLQLSELVRERRK